MIRIEEAIKQSKFKNDFQKAHINILYTASFLNALTANALKPYNITVQQFNILRILRGMYPKAATVKLLTERMLDKTSNASRLVEKLRQKGLVERDPCSNDRRRVNVIITEDGLNLLEKASDVIDKGVLDFNQAMTNDEAAVLNNLLDKLRG